MRPPRHPQSPLLAPLNYILGRETAVRLLRVLASREEAINRAQLAREAALDPAGARRALAELTDAGIIAQQGMGRAQQVRLRSGHPLSRAVRRLFADEERWTRGATEALRRIATKLRSPPRAMWLIESDSAGASPLGSTITVAALTTSREATETRDALRLALDQLEHQLGLTFDLRIWTEPDLQALNDAGREELARARPLLGPPATAFGMDTVAQRARARTPVRTHGDLDARARALGEAVADKLARDPELIRRARQAVRRRLRQAAPGERAVLQEWGQFLSASTPMQIRRLLVDPGPRATRLRQSLPFADVLTQEERQAVIDGLPTSLTHRRDA